MTGVQTCALPIFGAAHRGRVRAREAQAGVLQRGGELVLLAGEATEGVLWGGAAQDRPHGLQPQPASVSWICSQ